MENQPTNQPAPESPKPVENLPQTTPEVQPVQPAEAAPNAASQPAAASVQNPPLAQPQPQVGIQPQSQQQQTPAIPPTPPEAEDVDLIEKEWVDAAEKVVQQTADDPYQQEEAVEKLQLDYLKKRYGKEIKKPEGS
jgi:hypothetical protein